MKGSQQRNIHTERDRQTHRHTDTQREKLTVINMTSEIQLPFEGCHKNLSAKLKVQTTPLNKKDCHSTESSIQRTIYAFEEYVHIF